MQNTKVKSIRQVTLRPRWSAGSKVTFLLRILQVSSQWSDANREKDALAKKSDEFQRECHQLKGQIEDFKREKVPSSLTSHFYSVRLVLGGGFSGSIRRELGVSFFFRFGASLSFLSQIWRQRLSLRLVSSRLSPSLVLLICLCRLRVVTGMFAG